MKKTKLQKRCKKINKNQAIKLVKNSKFVLNLAIKLGGSSIRDFKNISGKSGLFQNEFKVYGRENKNCIRENCKGKISKIFISNRSTFFVIYVKNNLIKLLTIFDYQAIQSRVWQTQNLQLNQLKK